MSDPVMLVAQPDQVLAGKYRLIREIGLGGMSAVWEAEHLTLRSRVAVKIVSPALAATPEARLRFFREAKVVSVLRGPHIVQLIDFGVADDTPFMVMELLRGESLEALLHRVKRLSFAQVALIFRHLGRALGAAHAAGVVHRDLKPANIFAVDDGDTKLIKLLDFGIAKPMSLLHTAPMRMTATGALLGTPLYASPEQAEGLKTVDHRSDIWAMGVVAFECLLGWSPFSADTLGGVLLAVCSRPLPVPSEWGPVPPGFDKWFARACHRDPRARYQSAEQAAQLLRWILKEPLRAAAAPDGAAALPAVSSQRPAVSHARRRATAQPTPREAQTPPRAPEPDAAVWRESPAGRAPWHEWAKHAALAILVSVWSRGALASAFARARGMFGGDRRWRAVLYYFPIALTPLLGWSMYEVLTRDGSTAESTHALVSANAPPARRSAEGGPGRSSQEAQVPEPIPRDSLAAKGDPLGEPPVPQPLESRPAVRVAPPALDAPPAAAPLSGSNTPRPPAPAGSAKSALSHRRAVAVARTVEKPKIEKASAELDCRQPYWIDERGIRRLKMACLVPETVDRKGQMDTTGKASASDCNPPWYVDVAGIRRIKPVCM